MLPLNRTRALPLGLFAILVAIAPAPPEKPNNLRELATTRHKAALAQFEEVWTFYRQSRTESFPVYYWSRLILDSQRDISEKTADRIEALEGHVDRMKRLETLVKKVRRLGFGFSTDLGATQYYRLEAEFWLAQAQAQ